MPCRDRSPYLMPRIAILIGGIILSGCGADRSLSQIEQEMRSLDTLYLTAGSGKKITAAATKGVFVDGESGELCFPAYVCTNPECPGSQGDGQPFLFIHRDVMLRVGPGGEIVRDEMPQGRNPVDVIESRGGFANPTCPACWEVRRGRPETQAMKQQFVEWAQPYTLPVAAARKKELEDEYQRKAAAKSGSRRRSNVGR